MHQSTNITRFIDVLKFQVASKRRLRSPIRAPVMWNHIRVAHIVIDGRQGVVGVLRELDVPRRGMGVIVVELPKTRIRPRRELVPFEVFAGCKLPDALKMR